MRGMSCLRRRVASDHGFFTSCCILPWRATLSESVEYIPLNPVRAGWRCLAHQWTVDGVDGIKPKRRSASPICAFDLGIELSPFLFIHIVG